MKGSLTEEMLSTLDFGDVYGLRRRISTPVGTSIARPCDTLVARHMEF